MADAAQQQRTSAQEAHQSTNPAPSHSHNPPQNASRPGMNIPYLSGHNLMMLGRRDSDYRTRRFALQVAGQDTLSGATYDQLEQLVSVALPINRDNFIRVWKTLMLKRAQDVLERETHVRPAGYIRISGSIIIPGPLADLLYSIGRFHSSSRGFIYEVAPPDLDNPPAGWQVMDPAIFATFQQTCHRMKHLFLMKEFPMASEFDGKPLVLTRALDANNLRSVKAYTNEPTPADCLITLVNDALFLDGNNITFDEFSLILAQGLDRMSVAYEYIGSYVLNSNS